MVRRVIPEDMELKSVELELFLAHEMIDGKVNHAESHESGVLDVAAVSMSLPMDRVAVS